MRLNHSPSARHRPTRYLPSRTLFLSAGALILLGTVPLPAPEVSRTSSPPSPPAAAPSLDVSGRVKRAYPDLERLYQHLHAHPELSDEESATATRLVRELEGTGFEITPHFGGQGLVAVLRNGEGPTVLVRTEMDALPVTELTGLPYASQVRMRGPDGAEVGVMHACGHDMHMACWVGTARLLASTRDHWQGTLVFIAQPSEEIGAGADQMLAAGLYTKFPRRTTVWPSIVIPSSLAATSPSPRGWRWRTSIC